VPGPRSPHPKKRGGGGGGGGGGEGGGGGGGGGWGGWGGGGGVGGVGAPTQPNPPEPFGTARVMKPRALFAKSNRIVRSTIVRQPRAHSSGFAVPPLPSMIALKKHIGRGQGTAMAQDHCILTPVRIASNCQQIAPPTQTNRFRGTSLQLHPQQIQPRLRARHFLFSCFPIPTRSAFAVVKQEKSTPMVE